MTFQGDPYRELGIAPGASLNEIRSAYRRLAKQYHPDAAGDRALPRFLAIQAAYERLVGLRGPAAASDRRRGLGAPGVRGMARRSSEGARVAGGLAGAPRGRHDDRRPSTRPDDPPPTGARRRRRPREKHTRRGSRKATPGRRPTTRRRRPRSIPRGRAGPGTAPPRRPTGRSTRASTPTRASTAPSTWRAPVAPPSRRRDPRAAHRPTPRQPPTPARPAGGSAAGRRRPTATGAGAPTAGPTRRRRTRPRLGRGVARAAPTPVGRAPTVPPRAAEPLPDLEAVARRAAPWNLLALARRPDRRWRLLVALLAWPPVGYGVGTLLATTTGCAQFSAPLPRAAAAAVHWPSSRW